MAFEYFSEDHLYSSNHAAPSIVTLNILDAFAVCEPISISEYEQEFISLLIIIMMAK
jgi:hypothetical protein